MTDLKAELAEAVRLADKATPGIWPKHTCPDATPNEALIQLGAGYIEFGGSRNQREANAEAVVAALNYIRTHHTTLTRILESEATLSANYEALVTRLGEVTTELEKARKDAATERAIQRAAEVLPYGYGLTIYVERDSGYADLTDPSGDVVPFDTDGHGMAEQINNAIDAAMHDSAREG